MAGRPARDDIDAEGDKRRHFPPPAGEGAATVAEAAGENPPIPSEASGDGGE